MKRGQTSIFILITILIIASVVSIYTFGGSFNKINPEFQPIYSFVEDCIADTGEDAIYYISARGGYIEPINYSYIEYEIEPSTDNQSGINASHNVAYYIYNREKKMPSKQKIQEEISDYIDNFLYFCTNQIDTLEEYETTTGEVQTEVVIKDNEIILNSNYPVNVKKEEYATSFEDFQIKIPVRTGLVYNVAEEIVEEEKQRSAICMTCLYDLSIENNLTINMLEGDDKGIIFVITDKQSRIYEDNYKFYFAKHMELENASE